MQKVVEMFERNDQVIVVRPRRNAQASNICQSLYHTFAHVGDMVLQFPYKLFYVMLFVLSLLIPLFGIFVLGCILCSAHRGGI